MISITLILDNIYKISEKRELQQNTNIKYYHNASVQIARKYYHGVSRVIQKLLKGGV